MRACDMCKIEFGEHLIKVEFFRRLVPREGHSYSTSSVPDHTSEICELCFDVLKDVMQGKYNLSIAGEYSLSSNDIKIFHRK